MKVRFYQVSGSNGAILSSSVATQEEFKHILTYSSFPGVYKANMLDSISGHSEVKPILFFLETSPIFNYCLVDSQQGVKMLEKTNTLHKFITIFSDELFGTTGL